MLADALTALPALGTITIFGSGRLGPTLAALVGLAGAALAAQAVLRTRRTGAPTGEVPPPPTAVALGLVALVLGAVFLAAADGGPGDGDGVVGSSAAIALGVIAVALDRAALAPRRPHPTT